MRICVYGAASNEIDQIYINTVEELGRKMARRGIKLVFGGGAQGLMGAAARGAHSEKGQILGVAPTFFDVDGVLFKECTEFVPTETMRQRKQIMEDNSDAFIMVPGGLGTFEEFFEILTLKQLERHKKPIVVLNIANYYDPLIALIEKSMEGKFTKTACRALYYVTDSVEDALRYIENYKPDNLGIKDLRNIEATLDNTAIRV